MHLIAELNLKNCLLGYKVNSERGTCFMLKYTNLDCYLLTIQYLIYVEKRQEANGIHLMYFV